MDRNSEGLARFEEVGLMTFIEWLHSSFANVVEDRDQTSLEFPFQSRTVQVLFLIELERDPACTELDVRAGQEDVVDVLFFDGAVEVECHAFRVRWFEEVRVETAILDDTYIGNFNVFHEMTAFTVNTVGDVLVDDAVESARFENV